MSKEMRQHIDKFNKFRISENLNISDVRSSKKLTNYIVSYTKDSTKTDVDVSIGSDNLDDLVKRLRSILSDSEFDSIWKIETGGMSFG